MDLMEILKALFGDEALTLEQFCRKGKQCGRC